MKQLVDGVRNDRSCVCTLLDLHTQDEETAPVVSGVLSPTDNGLTTETIGSLSEGKRGHLVYPST